MEKSKNRLWHLLIILMTSCLGTETPKTKGLLIDNPECFTDAMCDEIKGSAPSCRVNVCQNYQCVTDYPDRDQDGEKDAACCSNHDCVDCDDRNANVNSRAIEQCNGLDDNCNGQIDENYVCGGEGSVATTEICDGIDNNDNGQIDEFLYHPSDLFLLLDVGKPLAFEPFDGSLFIVMQYTNGSIWLDKLTYGFTWIDNWALFNDGDTTRTIVKTVIRNGKVYFLASYTHTDGTQSVRWHSFDLVTQDEVDSEVITNVSNASLIIADASIYIASRDASAGSLSVRGFDGSGGFTSAVALCTCPDDQYEILQMQALACDGQLGMIVLWADRSGYTSLDYTSFDPRTNRVESTAVLRSGIGISDFEAGCSRVYTGMYLLYKQDEPATTSMIAVSTIRLAKLSYLTGFSTADMDIAIDSVPITADVNSTHYHAHLINTNIGTAVIWNDAIRLNFKGFDQRLNETIRFMNLSSQRPSGDFIITWIDGQFVTAWPEIDTSIFGGYQYEITKGRTIFCGE